MRNEADVIKAILDLIDSNPETGCVVGITGEWGSGKTYLWKHKIAKELNEDLIVNVSLLGIETLAALKQRTINACLLKRGNQIKQKKYKKAFENPMDAISAGLKLIVKGFDSKFGTKILANNIDLIQLVNKNAIICFDDVERRAKSLHLEEMLGFFKILADLRDCKIVVITNYDHFDSDNKKTFNLFREKIFDAVINIQADQEAIFDMRTASFSENKDLYEFLISKKKSLLSIFSQSEHRNLRTFNRAIDIVVTLHKHGTPNLKNEHIKFLCALLIENAEGDLKDCEFYNFNGVSVAFQIRNKEKNNETQNPKESFYLRFFEKNENYVYVESFCEYLNQGYIDWSKLKNEIDPSLAPQTTAQELVAELKSTQWFFQSEEEIRSLLEKISRLVSSSEKLTSIEIFTLLIYYRLGLSEIGGNEHSGFNESIRKRLIENAKNLDDTFNRHGQMHFSQQHDLWNDEFQFYKEMLDRENGVIIGKKLLSAIEKYDFEFIWNLAHSNFENLKQLVTVNVLEKLKTIQNDRPSFFYQYIHFIISELQFTEPSERTSIKKIISEFLDREISNSDTDKRQKKRINSLKDEIEKKLKPIK